ncbi:MAG: T9SS type A sorting domain-containing protein [Bacteroidetes bacterium]|nr:T9SS type A sorting domain-containing protein [Bacteroidota bacterium]
MQKIRISFLLKWTLLLLLSTSNVFSQEIEWQNTIGGSGDDLFTSIQQTADGGYILGGYSSSNISADKTENGLGVYDYWIVKTDSAGNILWQNTIGGSETDQLQSIKQTSDGGFILGGSSDSNISGDKTENCLGGTDYWMVKTDAMGTIQWQNTIGGSGYEYLFSIEQTTDGGYILGGYSSSNISGDKSENSIGGNDYWIVKTDSTGNVQWQNTIGGSSSDILYSINQTTDEGFILGGYSLSNITGDKTENNLGGRDYWIVKTDSTGNIQWQNTIGGSSNDQLQSIKQTTDGGYILGGYSESYISGDKTENSMGGVDYWIVKTDSTGTIQWQNTIGGSLKDYLLSLEQSTDGGYVCVGYSESYFSGDKTENILGGWDYWIVKTDGAGNIQWQNTLGGNTDDFTYSIVQTIDGGFILGGNSDSNISGDKTEISLGVGGDYWIVKLTTNYNLINGKLYADLNSNGAQDSGEPPLLSRKIMEQNTGRFAFSDQNGNYSVSVLDSGNFTVSPQTVNWYNSVPSSQSVSFSGIQLTDSINDFAFQPTGVFNDVCVSIVPLGNFRSGFNASYAISYSNNGNTTISPSVVFFPDSILNYITASILPTLISIDSVVWTLPALAPFQTGNIVLTINIDPGLQIGSPVNSNVRIEPLANDADPTCNFATSQVLLSGSFDPNDILVSEDTLTTTQLSNAPWLEYIIRFQNTGNDTAFTVKILNPIDTNKLNLSTIEFVNASHPVNLNWIDYQRNMEFKFENILLPDSSTNEPLSHGFVRYRIQPKTNLSAGDSITNFAAIYFDFNEPEITNTAKTIILLPTGIASASPTLGKLHVFPNPAESTLNISGIQLENGKAQLRLTDIYGKLILEKTISSITTTLETINLSLGIYLIQSGELRATFVKQ